jgi:hypothetical protein
MAGRRRNSSPRPWRHLAKLYILIAAEDEEDTMVTEFKKWSKEELVEFSKEVGSHWKAQTIASMALELAADVDKIKAVLEKADLSSPPPDPEDEELGKEAERKDREEEEKNNETVKEKDKNKGGKDQKKEEGKGAAKPLTVPALRVHVSAIEGVKRSMEPELRRLFPDAAESYGGRSKDEYNVYTKVMRAILVMEALTMDQYIEPEEMLVEFGLIKDILAKRMLSVHTFEVEGWAIAKHIRVSEDSFLESEAVRTELKLARKMAGTVKEKGGGRGQQRGAQRGGRRWERRERVEPYTPYGQRQGGYQQGQQRAPWPKRDKSMILCYGCNTLGHYKYECTSTPKAQGGAGP